MSDTDVKVQDEFGFTGFDNLCLYMEGVIKAYRALVDCPLTGTIHDPINEAWGLLWDKFEMSNWNFTKGEY